MIALSCPHCQKNLKIKDELAGKKIRCPACKETVEVTAAREDATLPPSSPPQEDATLPPSPLSPNGEATVGLPGNGLTFFSSAASSNHQRYEVESEIARGGMGAIMRANDRDIEREVAIKYLLNQADERQKSRFVEEAKITGQLEHPNIVPIHDLGLDADGQMYFSMKMVKGRSLAEILQDLDETPEYTLSRLLTIFSNVCNALAYAHSRNVIHRDLKPANIMIGDFGEVYVMDWGVAKVLTSQERKRPEKEKTQVKAKASLTQSGGMVKTNRTQAADMTQDGAIMGTPAYMPPEQARGEIDAIDARSDVYSLGAILYEMLTLTPPVGRGGDAMAVLMRVVDGTIDLPTKRTPKRWIPPELSAVAMKALALEPNERYQSVEALQRDIQLFQEGRSVSAKHDSTWEMFKKLVKRNKGASVGAAVALLVLLGSLVFIGKAWIETGNAYAAFQKEQAEKAERTKKAVPALLEAAQLAIDRKESERASQQVEVALEYDPDNAAARLLKGELLAARKEFKAARDELERSVKSRPNEQAVRLMELCVEAETRDVEAELGTQLVLLGQTSLAMPFFESNKKRLPLFQKQVEAALPGKGKALILYKDNNFHFGKDELDDLTHLKGIPISSLYVPQGKFRDLSPLKGMPLRWVDLSSCKNVSDLTPLKGMRLETLSVSGTQVKDLTPLTGMPLQELTVSQPVLDLAPLKGMPLKRLHLTSMEITNLASLEGLSLESLNVGACHKLSDLSGLRGMPLKELRLYRTRVLDLVPLQGMPLEKLNLEGCSALKDLSLLQSLPLIDLDLTGCGAEDLTPLKGLSLVSLRFTPATIKKGMEVLQEMPSLKIIMVGKDNLTPEAFFKKWKAGEYNK